ncbi:hypothetical protein ACNSOL_05765 [Aliarcobacter lanthieri]|uniref:hypothetical protein n=1 Tax=Aliarcobacter lanthieri TaxID=1355374 RepID=UPI003AAF2D1E
MNKKENSHIKSTILSLLAISFIVIGYFSIDFNAFYQSLKGEVKYIIQDKNCDLRKESCKIVIQDDTEFILSIEPKDFPLMKPLKFSIKSNRSDLENLSLNIYSTTMFMGEFYLDIKNLGNGNYEATGTLPSCTVEKMSWNADIKIEKSTEAIGARFFFETEI